MSQIRIRIRILQSSHLFSNQYEILTTLHRSLGVTVHWRTTNVSLVDEETSVFLGSDRVQILIVYEGRRIEELGRAGREEEEEQEQIHIRRSERRTVGSDFSRNWEWVEGGVMEWKDISPLSPRALSHLFWCVWDSWDSYQGNERQPKGGW